MVVFLPIFTEKEREKKQTSMIKAGNINVPLNNQEEKVFCNEQLSLDGKQRSFLESITDSASIQGFKFLFKLKDHKFWLKQVRYNAQVHLIMCHLTVLRSLICLHESRKCLILVDCKTD